MINVATDHLITLEEAAVFFPAINGTPKRSRALYRYIKEGVRGVVLESIRDGGRVYTTRAAVEEFVERLNTPLHIPPAAKIPKSRIPPETRASRAVAQIEKMFSTARRSAKK